MKGVHKNALFPLLKVSVLEKGQKPKFGWIPCIIGEHLSFDTKRLETYCFSSWQPVIFDAFLLAAAVEFCDRVKKRLVFRQAREISLRLPVHELERWNRKDVLDSLHDALNFLTGDVWDISFVTRKKAEAPLRQNSLPLPSGARAVIPFSDGMDSRAVFELLAATEFHDAYNSLIRIRLGSKTIDTAEDLKSTPFASVPYQVKSLEYNFPENSARSRGFKFLLLGGLAAYLAKAPEAIVPESGQGALGPALIPVGQAYGDYRNHPLFTVRLEKFIFALLGYHVKYRFPRLWYTKGETLKAYLENTRDDSSWRNTWSCWQQNRHVSVSRSKRQCGICAACMLRRMSVHAAGASEPNENYVWENLSASTYEQGASSAFKKEKRTAALNEYAIAGTLHMDHLADLYRKPHHRPALSRHSDQLAMALSLSSQEAEKKLNRLLKQHTAEWQEFLEFLGNKSFVAKWTDKVS